MTVQPSVYSPTPVMKTTTAPSTFRLTTPISSSSTSSSSRGPWRRCALWLANSGRWMIRRRYELAPLAGTTGISALGLAQTGTGAEFWYALLAAGGAAAGASGLKNKNAAMAYVGGGATVALGDIATAIGFGMSWPTVTAWALSTGAAYGAYVPWLIKRRHERMKLQLDTLRAKGALVDAMGLEAADPGLTGDSPEETALRRALHALTKHVPLQVVGMHKTLDGSWACIATMPAGTNTSPTAIMKRRTQLQANIGLPGRMVLDYGPGPNDLVIKMLQTDALAGTIPFEDSGDTSCTIPVLLGRDEEGREMRLDVLYRHTLIAGATNWGKSGISNLLILRLAKCIDAKLYGIDMKPGAPELGPWRSVMQVATNKHEARALLEWLYNEEAPRRGAILEELSKQSMAEGSGPVRKWIPGVHGDALFVFTDELAELVRQDKELAKLYESLLAIVRFLGIHFISATQQPSAQVFGGNTDARGNYGNKLSTRVGEPGHGPFIFGQGSQGKGWRPEYLDQPGKFLAMTPEHDDPRRIYRAQYVSDRDIAQAVQFHYSDVRDTEPQPVLTDEPWVEKFAPLRFPDGKPVDAWPDLYRTFQQLGSATKKELAEHCQISRDTAMRAIEAWLKHGVQQQRDGRSTRYYLPDTTTTAQETS